MSRTEGEYVFGPSNTKIHDGLLPNLESSLYGPHYRPNADVCLEHLGLLESYCARFIALGGTCIVVRNGQSLIDW